MIDRAIEHSLLRRRIGILIGAFGGVAIYELVFPGGGKFITVMDAAWWVGFAFIMEWLSERGW